MNGSSTIAPKTRRTEELRPEQSFIVWILSRLDIKSDLLSSLLSNLLSSLLSVLGAPWGTPCTGSVRVVSGLWSGSVRVMSESGWLDSVAMFTIVFSRLLTPSQNRLINVAAFGTPAIENLRSTSLTPRRITPPSVFANELYDSHKESGNPPDASLHSVWTTSPCLTSRSICFAVSFTKMSIPHSPAGFKREMRCWESARGGGAGTPRRGVPPIRPRQARPLPLVVVRLLSFSSREEITRG